MKTLPPPQKQPPQQQQLLPHVVALCHILRMAAHPTLILPHLALSPAPDKTSLQQPPAAATAHPRRPPAPNLKRAAAVALTTKSLLLPACVHRLPLPSVLCVSKVLLLLPPPFLSFAITSVSPLPSFCLAPICRSPIPCASRPFLLLLLLLTPPPQPPAAAAAAAHPRPPPAPGYHHTVHLLPPFVSMSGKARSGAAKRCPERSRPATHRLPSLSYCTPISPCWLTYG